MTLIKSFSLSGGDGDNSGENSIGKIIDALETLVENLRKECYAKFADRDQHNNLKKRIDELEKQYKEIE
jgi:hypothetical protein